MILMSENKAGHSHAGHRDRVKSRFEKEGLSGFEDHVALEMLLFYAIPQRDTNNTAHDLINEFGSLSGVFEASVESLERVKGVGRNAAILIKLIPEMYSKYQLDKAKNSSLILDSAEKVGKYFVSKYIGLTHEVLMAVCLDNKCRVKKSFVVSEGSIGSTDVNLRKIAGMAINVNASSVIIAHNHPAGVAAPSSGDVEAVRVIVNTLRKLDIVLCDSIIVAGENYYSMADHQKFAHLFDY